MSIYFFTIVSCTSYKIYQIKEVTIRNSFILDSIVNLPEVLSKKAPVFQIRKGWALSKFPLSNKDGQTVPMKMISNSEDVSFFVLLRDCKLNGQSIEKYAIIRKDKIGWAVEKSMSVENKMIVGHLSDDETIRISTTQSEDANEATIEEYLFYNNTFQVSLTKHAYALDKDMMDKGLHYNFYHEDSLIAKRKKVLCDLPQDIFYAKHDKIYGFINNTELIIFDGTRVQSLAKVEVFPNRLFIQGVKGFTISGDWVVFAVIQNINRTEGTLVIDHVPQLEYGLLCINYKTGESFLPDYELVD